MASDLRQNNNTARLNHIYSWAKRNFGKPLLPSKFYHGVE